MLLSIFRECEYQKVYSKRIYTGEISERIRKGENKSVYALHWQYAILQTEEKIQDDRFLDGQQTLFISIFDPVRKEENRISLYKRSIREDESCSHYSRCEMENAFRELHKL